MRDSIRLRRPSPGTAFGLLALIVALGGTALAGPVATTSKLNKKEKKQTRNIARSEINAAAGNLSVASARTATSATSAQTATSATNAQTAANATNAANAGQVDGHDATCPAGTFLRNGVCFDSAVRFAMAVWSSGTQGCADAGGRLPSISELQSIRSIVDLGPAGDGHWADVAWDDGGALEAMTVSQAAGTTEPQPVGNFNQVRCAFNLVR